MWLRGELLRKQAARKKGGSRTDGRLTLKARPMLLWSTVSLQTSRALIATDVTTNQRIRRDSNHRSSSADPLVTGLCL